MSYPDDTSPIVRFIAILAQCSGPRSAPEHILRQGKEFISQTLTEAELDYAAMIQWTRRAEKQCYYNCQVEAILLPATTGITLRYVEGYIDPGCGIAIDHAWLSVNGKVVDPTVRLKQVMSDRVIGVIPSKWHYYGVELQPEACRHALVHQAAVSLIDDHECGYPLIPSPDQEP